MPRRRRGKVGAGSGGSRRKAGASEPPVILPSQPEDSQDEGEGLQTEKMEVDFEDSEGLPASAVDIDTAPPDTTVPSPITVTAAAPVFARKSKPRLVKAKAGTRFQWLGTPSKVLNRVKTEEELKELGCWAEVGEAEDEEADTSSSSEDDEDGWESLSEEEEAEYGDWEEQLVYVELDDVPSLQELFAVQPDDFMRFQKKKFHSKFSKLQEPRKETHPTVEMKFHEFSSSAPVLQIGERYFACRWKEAIGEAMLFKKKGDGNALKKENGRSECLSNIVPGPEIPWDNVFGSNHLLSNDSYELVALADKVLKTELLEADTKTISSVFAGREFFARPGTHKFKIPQGYTATDLLAGQYKPKRTYTRKRKEKTDWEGDERESESTEAEQPSPSRKASTSRNLGPKDIPEGRCSPMDTSTTAD